jgi:hypothetical protein
MEACLDMIRIELGALGAIRLYMYIAIVLESFASLSNYQTFRGIVKLHNTDMLFLVGERRS